MKDRKTTILEAAARVIARRGVRGLRIEELATEAGVSKALVYYHFGDRARLLRHTLRFIGDRARRYAHHPAPGPGDGPGGPGDGADGPGGPGHWRRELEHRLLLDLRDAPEARDNSTAWGELRAGAIFEPELREELARASLEWVRETTDLLGRVAPTAPDAALAAAAERLGVLLEGLTTRWLIGILPVSHARDLVRDAIGAEVAGLHLRTRDAVGAAVPGARGAGTPTRREFD
ncbi:TetR/AcrR family transcriptional regulator [Streptomyces sp. NPDC093225]|uniref:TetR/AcrR family transcriptional regulator n=1 Tax=Streptomyces sp. NPDC093225 TaxID=3366034 RepID=UPI0037FA2B95